MKTIKEQDLTYTLIRELSPQWKVIVNDVEVAIVTERYVSEPPFAVVMNHEQKTFNSRFQVSDHILTTLNERAEIREQELHKN